MANARRRPVAHAIATAIAGIALLLSVASVAEGFVYFDSTANPGHTIGRANLDGGGVNLTFIANADTPCGIDADGTHLYWANNFNGSGSNTIGRSNINGSAVNQSFISGARSPCGVAVDGAHIYWANTSGPIECMSNCTSIGRANLDGSGVNQAFISGLGQANGVAVDGAHVYWTDRGGTIGRADIDGTDAEPSFITGLVEPRSIAVNGSHLYWGTWASETIGRANVDGTGVDADFITIPNDESTLMAPCAVAVDATHVYWSYQTNNLDIGRAKLDGTGVEHMIAPSGGCGVAVDALNPSATAITPATTASMPFGEILSFTAKVTSASPGVNPATPTGTVQFAVDGFDWGPPVALDAGGEADIEAFVDVGGTVTARYGGSASFAASSAGLSPNVRPAATATALTASANPAVAGTVVTFVAKVSNTENDFTPFGSIQFLVDGDAVVEPLALDDDGEAAVVASDLEPGQYDVRALYHDDTAAIPDFLDSQAVLTQRITVPVAPPLSPPAPPPAPPLAPATTITPQLSANNAFTLLRRTASSAGVIRLSLRSADAGALRATATRCSPARRRCAATSPVYGSGRTPTLGSGGSVTLIVRPNAKTRAALARGRSMRVTVTIKFRSAKGGEPSTKRTSLLVKGRRAARR